MNKQIAIGIDVGGSHASCAAFDMTEKRLITESISHIPLNNQGSKTEVIEGFVSLIRACTDKIKLDDLVGIGIAMPGPFDYENGIGLFTGENAKFQCLNKVNVELELKEKLNLPEISVRFINDATAFAIGEYFLGQLKGCKHTLAITLGTGLGSAFLSDGIPVIVDEKVPENGCIWHLPFENGIADDYFSTRGLVNRYFERTGTKLKGVKELAELSKENSLALELFHDFGEKLALFLAPWFKSFQVEAIVFGGNISKASHLFNDAMNEQFKKEGLLVKINYSELQESAAFVGAAQLLNEEFWSLVKSQLKYM